MSRGAFCLLASLLLAVPAAAALPSPPARISVVVRGTGPDVVLIPGLAASRGVWNGTVAAVPGYRYHLVQLAGFAGTPPGGNATGRIAAGAAEEIARYIAENRLVRPAIVGHSMGGSIAMMIAARHPRAAGRVMVVDMLPSPGGSFGMPLPVMKPLARVLGGEVQRASRLAQRLQPVAARFGNADWMSNRSDAEVVGRSVEELLATDLRPELPRIRAPLTVVYACPAALHAACAPVSRVYSGAYSRRPGTRLVRIERSGHTIMWDQPAAFRAELRRFLAERRAGQ